HQSARSPSIAAISSSTDACVERHATTARLPRASSRPIALSKCVFPRPLLPTSTSGLYFLPGCFSTARAALTATSLDGPTAYAASGNAADGAGGGAAPSRTLAATSTAPRPPRFDRFPHGDGHVGEEVAELVARPGPGGRAFPRGPLAAAAGRARGLRPDAEQLFRRLRVDGPVVDRLECHEPVERAHQLAHVAGLRARDRLEHTRLELGPALVGLPAQDRDPRFVIRRPDVHHQAAREPRA